MIEKLRDKRQEPDPRSYIHHTFWLGERLQDHQDLETSQQLVFISSISNLTLGIKLQFLLRYLQ